MRRTSDSAGNTIHFLLLTRPGFRRSRAFLQLAVVQAARIQPRVMNVDEHPKHTRPLLMI